MKSSRPKNSISITDIALRCGVSAMTVSRVLRQSPDVRSETREKVLSAAEELGYLKGSRLGRPAGTDGTGRHIRVRLICGVTGRGPGVFQMRLLSALERGLTAHNCECVLYCGNGEYRAFLRLLESARETSAQATFIIGEFPEKQLASLVSAFPGAVLIDNPGIPESDATFSAFAFDNRAAARLALEHLLTLGRREIVVVTGFRSHFFTREMEDGCRAFAAKHHLTPVILYTDFTPASAEAVMRKHILSGKPFDGVFTNDEMAAGVYRALLSSGKTIPGDAAVCGCDNLPSGEMLYPSLTTISLDYESLAQNALEFVLKKKTSHVPLRTRLMPTLLIRESSGTAVRGNGPLRNSPETRREKTCADPCLRNDPPCPEAVPPGNNGSGFRKS